MQAVEPCLGLRVHLCQGGRLERQFGPSSEAPAQLSPRQRMTLNG